MYKTCYLCNNSNIIDIESHQKTSECLDIRNKTLINAEDIITDKFFLNNIKEKLKDFNKHKKQIEQNLIKNFSIYDNFILGLPKWAMMFVESLNNNEHVCVICIDNNHYINLDGIIYIDKQYKIMTKLCFPSMMIGLEKCIKHMKKNNCYDEYMVFLFKHLIYFTNK